MRKFENDIGCTAEFEDGISDEEIGRKLNFLGGIWKEMKDEKDDRKRGI